MKLREFQSYTFMDAELQAAILNNINAVINVTRSEEPFPLVQLDQHHVAAEFQEERLLKVAEHPESNILTINDNIQP